jgi:hypothetical protein
MTKKERQLVWKNRGAVGSDGEVVINKENAYLDGLRIPLACLSMVTVLLFEEPNRPMRSCHQ